jgi:adenine-specific DNA methylase
LPDPTDPRCPEAFKAVAREELQQFRRIGPSDADLLRALLGFVAELAEWDLVKKDFYVSTARKLVQAAYGPTPHVFDPFSGGGSIPLEGLRLGCEVTASELNPVAWIQLKIALEWCARKGSQLADLFDEWSGWVLKEAEKRLAEYYPADGQKRKPLAYLWARTVRCEATECGATIPLIRNLWLSEAKRPKKALRITYPNGSLEPHIEVFEPSSEKDVQRGTIGRTAAACPRCGVAMSRKRLQAQLRGRRGGADDALLLAVVRQKSGGRGKDYDAPTKTDLDAYAKAQNEAKAVRIEMPPFPRNYSQAFPSGLYGFETWADVLAPRQRFSRWVIHEVIEDALKAAGKKVKHKDLLDALAACLYVAYSDNLKQYLTVVHPFLTSRPASTWPTPTTPSITPRSAYGCRRESSRSSYRAPAFRCAQTSWRGIP